MRQLSVVFVIAVVSVIFLVAGVHLLRQSYETTYLVLSAGQPGGTYLPMAESIADIVNAAYPNINITVVESFGSVENIERLVKGQVDLALVQNDTPGDAMIRAMVPLHKEVLHFLVRRDSDINRIRDLVGKRVEVGPQDSGTEVLVRNLLRHYGISLDDFVPTYYGIIEACDKLLDGDVEAILVVQGLKSAKCQELIATGNVRFVGLGCPDIKGCEAEGFSMSYPFISPYTIPINSYLTTDIAQPGEPQEPVASLSVRSILVCHKDVPDEVIRKIIQAIFNHRPTLVRAFPVARQMTEHFDTAELQYSLHPGAMSYYNRDKPSFFLTHADIMAFLLTLTFAIFSLIALIRQRMIRQKRARIDHYYQQLEGLISRLNDPIVSEGVLRDIDNELWELRHSTIRELVGKKLMADQSFSIFHSLLSDCQMQVQQAKQVNS